MFTWIRIPQPFIRVCAVFTGILAFSILLGEKGKDSAMIGNLLDFFTEARGEGSRISWSHAVNSRQHLEDALKSKSMMLEADVSISSQSGKVVPIMAHPPASSSDITLEEWLMEVIKHKKGIKLDFKAIEVLVPSMSVLKKFEAQIKVPLLLNADILIGPRNPLANPLNPHKFLEMCKTSFPNSILSVGWTTYVDSSVVNPLYDDDMIKEMKKVILEAGIHQPVTFAVRACVAKNSISQLQDLLQTFPASTLTVWSSPGDSITVKDLLKFRSYFNLKSVYFDLPSPLKEEFVEAIAIE